MLEEEEEDVVVAADVTAGGGGGADPDAGAVGGGIGAWPGCGAGGCRLWAAPCCWLVAVGFAPVTTTGSASVSVSLPVGSGEVWRASSLCWVVFPSAPPEASSAALAAWTSRANQLMLYHRPAQRMERMPKWMEAVVMRRTRRSSWRELKVMLVARRRVGVGPGVKTDSQRLTRNEDMAWGWLWMFGCDLGLRCTFASRGRGRVLLREGGF